MSILTAAAGGAEGASQGNPKAKPTTDEPHPSILRRPTVQFDETDSSTRFYTDVGHEEEPGPRIVSPPEKSNTFESEASRASSKLEERWRKQTVLSFGKQSLLLVSSCTYVTIDGGGIRGYSSLLILKEIMRVVEELEKAEGDEADSSFHPGAWVTPHNRKNIAAPQNGPLHDGQENMATSSCRYLPCHYFDYIGGTSTG